MSQSNQDDLERDIKQAYADGLKDIESKIKDYIASNENITFAQQLDMLRLESLMQQINNRVDTTYKSIYSNMYDSEVKEFSEQYLGIFYEIEETAKIRMNFHMLNDAYINRAIQASPDGIRLSDRLYQKYKPQLQQDIKQSIVKHFVNGGGYVDISKDIRKSFDMSASHSLLIARTEGGRIRSIARQEGQQEAKNMGVNLEKRWVATLDDRTRTDHQILDGQTVPINHTFKLYDLKAMQPRTFGVASEDINCRCDTITVVEGIEPTLRIDNITKEFIPYKNYKDWADDRMQGQAPPKGDPTPQKGKAPKLDWKPKETEKILVKAPQNKNDANIQDDLLKFPKLDVPKFKTVKEAQQYMTDNLGFKQFDAMRGYKKDDLHQMVQTIADLYHEFPMLFEKVTSLKTTTSRTMGGSMGWNGLTSASFKGNFTLTVNASGLKTKEQFDSRKDLKGEFNADGTIQGVIRHEFGHALHNLLIMRKHGLVNEKGEFIGLDKVSESEFRENRSNAYKSWKTFEISDKMQSKVMDMSGYGDVNNPNLIRSLISNNVSQYATSTSSEFMSECMARSDADARPMELIGRKVLTNYLKAHFKF